MTFKISRKADKTIPSELIKGGVAKTLEATGKLPPVSIVLTPIDGSPPIFLDRFLQYSFSSSIIIPVDTFNFNFAATDDIPFYDRVKEGDIITLFANDVPISTGIIDTIDIETDNQYGEKVNISGRDLLAQVEDQSAVNDRQDPIWGNDMSLTQALNILIKDTRIQGYRIQDLASKNSLFATEPGESKLSALQRFLEPLNAVMFLDGKGQLVVGKPNMKQRPISVFKMSREKRDSNVISMKSIHSSATISNIIAPIWSGQETTVSRVSKEALLVNKAAGPLRLLKLGHRVPKAIVVSTPQGNSPQALSDVNTFRAGGSNVLQAFAKREVARQNHKELIVQAVVPGHYNALGDPYQVDTVYKVEYDRGRVDEAMYLFQVEYSGGEGSGQRTSLFFCKLGTIVAESFTG